MIELHAAIGPAITAALLLLSVAALASLRLPRLVSPVDAARRASLAVLAAQVAVGAALAARGAAPAEGIHWVYGALIVAALLIPGMLPADTGTGRRAATLAGASLFSVVMAWRLGASG